MSISIGSFLLSTELFGFIRYLNSKAGGLVKSRYADGFVKKFQIIGVLSNDHPPFGWLEFSASGRKDKSTSVLAALRLRKQTIACHKVYSSYAAVTTR